MPSRSEFTYDSPAERPRIALFSGNYNCVRDGANQALNRLVGHLERVGAEVRIFSPTVSDPAFPPTGDLHSVPSMAIPGRPEYRLARPLPRRMKQELKKFAPTIVHLSAPDMLGWSAMRWARANRVPVVSSLHTRFETYLDFYGAARLRPLVTAILRRFYAGCDLLLAPTPGIAQELRASIPQARVRLWSRGVDHDLFNPARRDLRWRRSLGLADDNVVLLFFGRVVREKGLQQFIDVASHLEDHVRPLVIGNGPAVDWLAGRLPDARFTGHLSGPDLARAVASADIFLNPSITEAFGNVTLEAMAAGLAVTCPAVPSATSLIADGETGLLFPPAAPTGAIDAVAALAGSASLRARLGQQARRASLAYGWDEASDMVVQAYGQLLGRAFVPAAAESAPEPFREPMASHA